VEHSGEHEACEAEIVEAFQGGIEPFVVSYEAAEAGSPGEGMRQWP